MGFRKILKIDEEKCNGCGECIPACAEGALKVVNGKAKLISDKYCDGLGACIGHCPLGAISIEERYAEEFDEGAVKNHLHTEKAINSSKQEETMLPQWPVQLKLVPTNAEFFKNSDLVVIADCVPFAYPSFYNEFQKDKTVVIGCPKFDNTQLYEKKLTDIFAQSNIQNVTVVNMEVPCCNGIHGIVRRALNAAGKRVSLKQEVISVRGKKVPPRQQEPKQISILEAK